MVIVIIVVVITIVVIIITITVIIVVVVFTVVVVVVIIIIMIIVILVVVVLVFSVTEQLTHAEKKRNNSTSPTTPSHDTMSSLEIVFQLLLLVEPEDVKLTETSDSDWALARSMGRRRPEAPCVSRASVGETRTAGGSIKSASSCSEGGSWTFFSLRSSVDEKDETVELEPCA
nr:hypothetical protein BaRGS_016645 [Batillaria attramentaria]